MPLPGFTTGSVEGGRATSAYVIPYGTDGASRLSVALLAEGFKIAVATRQMNAGGRNWPAGTLLARVDRNPETLHARIGELAGASGARVFAVNSAFSEEGDTGIGSETIVSLKQPRVAVVWDDATSPTSYGALWYTFERDYRLKFTPITMDALKAIDLSQFNVIILPDGSAGGYESLLGKPGVDKLKGWVRGGGVLVGIGGGATLFTRKEVDMTTSRLVGSDDDPIKSAPAQSPEQPAAQPTGGDVKGPVPSTPGTQKETEVKPKEKRAEAEAAVKPEEKPPVKRPTEPIAVPGSAFRVRVNRNHFLSYGYEQDSMVVLMGGDAFYRPSKDGANVLTFTADGPLTVSGFIWPNNTEELLRGTSYLIDEPMGRGHVILFAEDPNFRFLWRTTAQMFINSILLAPSM